MIKNKPKTQLVWYIFLHFFLSFAVDFDAQFSSCIHLLLFVSSHCCDQSKSFARSLELVRRAQRTIINVYYSVQFLMQFFVSSPFLFPQRPFLKLSVDLLIFVVCIWMREISTSISGLFALRIKQAKYHILGTWYCDEYTHCDLKSIAKTYTFFSPAFIKVSKYIECSCLMMAVHRTVCAQCAQWIFCCWLCAARPFGLAL